MKKQRYSFSYDEWQCIIHALNGLRNTLIGEGRYTDTVDETLCKFMAAKTRKTKTA
jgi:hypothetical protein